MMTLGAYEAKLQQKQREAAAHAATLKIVVEQAERAFTPQQRGAVAAAKKALAGDSQQLTAQQAAQRGSGRG
jgi:hypothetical protein